MIELKEVVEEDFEFLYNILRERNPEESIEHEKTPSYEEHIQFVKSKPYSCWYVIEYMKEKIGTVYLSKEDEVGIFLKREFQKKGIGKKALELLIKNNPRERIFANVNPKNSKSVRFFAEYGFKLIQNTYEFKVK